MINACVSHEMRNPLNSIIAHNLEKNFLYTELEQLVSNLKVNPQSLPTFFTKHDEVMKKLRKGLKVQ